MSWKDKLQPATFRGVPFHAEGDDMAAGRRVQVHEYPQRDKPYAEDLGRATREISISAFVIGPDYMAGRDRLLGALETAGPGTLVHPWYGSMQVVCTSVRVRHSNRDGGMAVFDLGFVEAGELSFPTSGAQTDAATRVAATTLNTAASTDFADTFSVAGVPDFVSASALGEVTASVDALRGALRGVVAGIDDAASAAGIANLLGAPGALAGAVLGLFGDAADVAGLPQQLSSRLRALLGFASLASLLPLAGATTTPARAAEQANTNALRALMRRGALASAAQAASYMDATVRDDVIAARGELVAALDAEAARATDATFDSITDLRVAVYRDMTDRSRDSARLRTLTPAGVTPAVVLAYDLYEDASRDAEIVARNRVQHPGFVPAEPLQVLSR